MMAAGWQQNHRVPAFGDWNYPRDDGAAAGGVDDWPPVAPCFDFASAARPAAAQQKCNNKGSSSSMPNARRMRVPAFGEWNHHGDGGGNGIGIGNGNGTWPAVMTPFFDLATPQKGPKKVQARRRRRGDGFDAAAAKLAMATAAAEPQGHMQTRRSKVADSGAYAAVRRSCFTVAKPVDDDLYGVPPDMLYGGKPAPRKEGWLRILRLLGCSCFSPS